MPCFISSLDRVWEDELTEALQRWKSDQRLEEAMKERSERHWQRQLAFEEARMSGLLQDLAEARTSVVVTTIAGRKHRGEIGNLGKDFVSLTDANGHTVFVVIKALSGVEVVGDLRSVKAPSARPLPETLPTLPELLALLAADQPRLRFALGASTETHTGVLIAVGADIVAFELDVPTGHIKYSPLDQLAEVSSVS